MPLHYIFDQSKWPGSTSSCPGAFVSTTGWRRTKSHRLLFEGDEMVGLDVSVQGENMCLVRQAQAHFNFGQFLQDSIARFPTVLSVQSLATRFWEKNRSTVNESTISLIRSILYLSLYLYLYILCAQQSHVLVCSSLLACPFAVSNSEGVEMFERVSTQ